MTDNHPRSARFAAALAASASIAALVMAAGCARQPGSAEPAASPAAPASDSILAWARPAVGSTVRRPVDELALHFSPPARLLEVTVSGPDGAMPMMVTAVGEVEHYSLPLPGLGPGQYTVEWKAGAGGAEHRGSFAFQVR